MTETRIRFPARALNLWMKDRLGQLRLAVVMQTFGSVHFALVSFLTLVLINNAIACFVCLVPYQSQLDKVESSRQVVVVRALDETLTRWKIVRVIKSDDNLDANQLGTIENSPLISTGKLHLLHRGAKDDSWTYLDTVDQEQMAFLTGALELSSKRPLKAARENQQQALSYFLPYLEHQNPVLADSAFHKILNAPYTDVRKLGEHLDPADLLEMIDDPQHDSKRRALYITLLGTCGGEHESALLKKWNDERWKNGNSGDLAAILAAHAELNGEETVRYIEKYYLQNRDRKLDELIEAVAALSLHGQADERIPRSRIAASYHLFLKERPPLLELIIEDCARWKDWSFAPKFMEIYESGQQPWNNAMIIKYLQACPLPSTKLFLQRVSNDS